MTAVLILQPVTINGALRSVGEIVETDELTAANLTRKGKVGAAPVKGAETEIESRDPLPVSREPKSKSKR